MLFQGLCQLLQIPATLNLDGFWSGSTVTWQYSTDDVHFNNMSSFVFDDYYRAVITNGGCSSTSNSVAVTTVPDPEGGIASVDGYFKIRKFGISNQVCQGTGTGLNLSGYVGSIQWQSSADNVHFNDINGATLSTLNTGNLNSDTYFRAAVSNGVCDDYSNVVHIEVIPASVAGTISPGSESVCSGTNVNLKISGNTGSIQWQSESGYVRKGYYVNYTNISGANSNNYSTGALNTTTHYRAVVSNEGCSSKTSNVVTLSVLPLPVAGTASATPDPVCYGSPTTLNLTGSYGNVQWQSTNTIRRTVHSTFKKISGATGTSYNTGNEYSTTYYHAVLFTPSCGSAVSNNVMVSVIPLPVAGNASASSQLVCAGLNTTLFINGNNGSVQWQVSVNDTFSFTTIPNATNSEYITPPLTTLLL